MIIRMYRFILLTTLLIASTVQAAELAGRVIMVRGQAEAISVNGEVRTLKRRDSVYVSDVVRTGSDSKVQIRFIDNALLALKADTELRISTYAVNQDSDGGTILMELIEGGFRTLTGSIGKGDKSDYEVRTPVASIGIRGTLYSVLLQQQQLLAGVWEGAIGLSSDLGQFQLGAGADFNFAVLSSEGFSGLLMPPTELQESTPVARNQQVNRSQSSTNVDNSEQASGSSSQRNDAGSLATVELDEAAPSAVLNDVSDGNTELDDASDDGKLASHSSTEDRQVTAQRDSSSDTDDGFDAQDIGDLADVPGVEEAGANVSENSSTASDITSLADLDIIIEDVDNCRESNDIANCVADLDDLDIDTPDTTDPEPTDPGPIDPDLPTSADIRLSDLEYQQLLTSDRVGAVVGGGDQRGGVVIQSDNSEPVFYVYNDRENRREVIRFDGTSSGIEQPLPGVEWGIWSGTTQQPVKAFVDSTDPTKFETREDKVLWVSASPIRSSDLAGLFGTVDFSSDAAGAASTGFDSKGQDLTKVDGQFTLNFDTGQISNGHLDALFGASDRWKIEFDGNIRVDDRNAALVNMSLLRGENSDGAINLDSSEFSGILLAPNADAFVGTFSLKDMNEANANGAVIWPLLNQR